MKKASRLIKKITIAMIVLVLFFSFQINTYAKDSLALDDVMSDAEDFLSKGTDNRISHNNIQNLSNNVVGILTSIGIAVSMLVISILGIQYMTSAVEEKAKVKENMTPFVVGCVVVFAGCAIWKAVVGILQWAA